MPRGERESHHPPAMESLKTGAGEPFGRLHLADDRARIAPPASHARDAHAAAVPARHRDLLPPARPAAGPFEGCAFDGAPTPCSAPQPKVSPKPAKDSLRTCRRRDSSITRNAAPAQAS